MTLPSAMMVLQSPRGAQLSRDHVAVEWNDALFRQHRGLVRFACHGLWSRDTQNRHPCCSVPQQFPRVPLTRENALTTPETILNIVMAAGHQTPEIDDGQQAQTRQMEPPFLRWKDPFRSISRTNMPPSTGRRWLARGPQLIAPSLVLPLLSNSHRNLQFGTVAMTACISPILLKCVPEPLVKAWL